MYVRTTLVQVSKSIKQSAQEWSTTSLNSAASQQQKQQQLKIFSVCAAFAKAAATSTRTSTATATFARIANDANSGTDVAKIVLISHIVPCVCTFRVFWCHCARKYNVWK